MGRLAAVLTAVMVSTSLPIGIAPVEAVVEGLQAPPVSRAPDKPITISGKVKNLNRDVELALDPASGNGLAVWNRSKRSQGFGQIWAAEIIRQGDGTYEAGEPFKVSGSKSAQRPTVEYLPEFGFYMIMWDTATKDPDKATRDSEIVSRLYEPVGAVTRRSDPGDLEPENTMTFGPGTHIAPGLVYNELIDDTWEELIYRWWEMGDGSARPGARLPRGSAGKNRTHVTRQKDTLTGGETGFPSESRYERPYTYQLSAIRCPDGRLCSLYAVTDLSAFPVLVQFAVACIDPATLRGSWMLLGEPVMVPGRLPGALVWVFGSLRPEGDKPLRAITSAGAFDVDPDAESARTVPFSLNPLDIVGAFFALPASPLPGGLRTAGGEGFVYVRPGRGKFEYRNVDADGDLTGGSTKLWKIKRKRFMNMSVARAGDTVLVAWAEAKNKRGTKGTIRLGWFVPE